MQGETLVRLGRVRRVILIKRGIRGKLGHMLMVMIAIIMGVDLARWHATHDQRHEQQRSGQASEGASEPEAREMADGLQRHPWRMPHIGYSLKEGANVWNIVCCS